MIGIFEKITWAKQIGFVIYGKKFGFQMDKADYSSEFKKILPPFSSECDFTEAEDIFSLITDFSSRNKGFYFNNEIALRFDDFDATLFKTLEAKIQFSLALSLPPEKYLFHAGAVAWKGLGVIFPGFRYTGKSTLTKEFIKHGADYYSDDCAVIDRRGFLYAYPEPLLIRSENDERRFYTPSELDARIGIKPAKVKIIAFTSFEKSAEWKGEIISEREAVWGLMENLFFPPSMNLHPQETFQALAEIVKGVILLKGKRGAAEDFVKNIFAILDDSANSNTDAKSSLN